MPIYEYIAEDPEKSCRICAKGFELMRPMDRAPLEHCMYCHNPVRKVISLVSTPRVSTVSAAKNAGMTVLKRRDKGVYEKL